MNNRRSYKLPIRKSKKSKLKYIVIAIFATILLGDIIGAVIFLRQSYETQNNLLIYMATGTEKNFFQTFTQQFLTQLTVWTMGLTVIGALGNFFIMFSRGVSAGFNLAFLAHNHAGIGAITVWFFQYLLILLATALGVFWSARFSILIILNLHKSKWAQLKKHFKIYAIQLGLLFVLTILTTTLSTMTLPGVREAVVQNNITVLTE